MQISDDARVRNLVYNSFNELEIREGCKPSYKDHPCLWLITWDPTQPVATRPLAIQKDGTWYTYGWDLTKNICEVFGQNGYIRSTYIYTPFGSVTATGDVTQPIQWSSEYYDSELALVYYNYRHYNPTDGRWINRDPIAEQGSRNLYRFVNNRCNIVDYYGLVYEEYKKVFIPTTGRIGTVKARIKDGKVEILHQKWLLPNFWNICTSPKQTSDFAWVPATDDDIKIFFTKTEDSFQVEKDPSVLFARSMGVQFKNIKVKE